jgi:cell division protein FtsI (penicillin-binding protein 3)
MSQEKTIRNQMLGRLSAVYFTLLVFLLILIGRIFYVQWFEGEKWRKAEQLNFRTTRIEPNRGDIRARDGRLLASSVPEYEIRMDLGSSAFDVQLFRNKIDSLSYLLSNLFRDKSAEQYKRELLSAQYRQERYYLVKKNVSYPQLKRLRKFPVFNAGSYKGGLIVKMEYKRVKPFGEMAARSIGYVFSSGKIRGVGIEGTYDSILSGVEGRRLEQRITGNFWKPVGSDIDIDPVQGHDIVTTIDVNIQDVAHNALLKILKQHNARHGAAILMEVKTGEILAMSNLMRTSIGNYVETYNFGVGERTEPGSTIKLASLMIALEDGYVNLNDVIDTGNGEMKIYDITIRDSKKEGFGKITVKEAMEVSSNIGVVKIVQNFYGNKPKDFIEKLYRFHLNQPTGIDLVGEPVPYIKYPGDKHWSGVSLYQMAYGYELQLTPLQILTFYNAIANDGVMVRPKIVKAIYKHGTLLKSFPTEIIDNRIASPKVIRQAQEMLEGVVENGTAKNLSRNAYKIAGKTGTAQIANAKYGYEYQSRVSYLASFAGYFPAKDPKYSCIVIVNEPSNSQYYGNAVAGPVFKEIADKVYATRPDMVQPLEERLAKDHELVPYTLSGKKTDLLSIMNLFDIPNIDMSNPNNPWVMTTKLEDKVRLQNRIFPNKQVPNVMGMGLRDALSVCENAGLKVEVNGRGIVTRQSLQPFTNIHGGERIVLNLSHNF